GARGVEVRLTAEIVGIVPIVVMVLEKDFAGFSLQEMEIHPLMFLIRTLSMILQKFSPTLHNPSTSQTHIKDYHNERTDIHYRRECEIKIDELKDSLIMGNEELSTIHEKKSDEFIKSSVEDLVLILSESKDTSWSDNEYDLSLCDDFSPIDVPEGKFEIFSNPLFDSNNDFTSSDD
nr:hypothetical protein [Tanacetum cinerariifolium]